VGGPDGPVRTETGVGEGVPSRGGKVRQGSPAPARAARTGPTPTRRDAAPPLPRGMVPPMGMRVGNYELEDEVFSSGPSTFFNARNVILGSPIVVRRLTIDPARAEDVKATFFREMRHQASFQHPAIWPPLDVMDTGGFLWSVHPTRRGVPSADRVSAQGPMSLSDASRYGGEIADALALIHGRGAVFGRVAPRWILVDERGAQLASFTKSADLAAGIWPLRPAVASLSPFSAPEELRGQRPTAEGDVYSLAATILWWLSAQYPAGGTTVEEAMDRVRRGARHLEVSQIRPDLPAVLGAALDGALHPDPLLRRGSAASLGTLLVETHRRLAAEIPSGFETGVHLLPTGAMQSLQILGRHGSGAFGVVFRARSRDGKDTFAIKALKPEHRHDQDARERFLREARSLEAIDHPNVVRIRGVGEEGGTPYAVMEFIPGPDLGTLLLKEGALPAPRAARLAVGIARGLEAIHHEGVLHRDLKPHNILVAPGDRPVVADFGVARSIQQARMTMTGTFVGTPAYMAPEQFEDLPPSFAVDLYALGAILHEMLTGQCPFTGRDAISTIRAIREQPPPRLPADVPSALADVVTRLLRKEPSERYVDATTLALDLEAIASTLEAEREIEPVPDTIPD
jgi:serine/threonine protein kinase